MTDPVFREATIEDIPSLAKIRADDWQSEAYWNDRIAGYINCTHHPGEALNTRVIYVAIINNAIIGFIAGHLTRRLHCDGELEWINTVPEFQRTGIASRLTRLLAKWFVAHEAYKVCIDPRR